MPLRVTWLLALALSSCTPSTVDLVIDLRTDFRAGTEFTDIRVILEPGGVVENAAPAGDYLTGVQVAELREVAPGTHNLVVTLFDEDGGVLIDQRLIVTIENDTALTVVVTRDCAGVVCGEAERCLRAECVPSECSALQPELCGATDCETASECMTPHACVTAQCASGSCLLAGDDALCSAAEVCDVADGCLSDRRLVLTGINGTSMGAGFELRINTAGDPAGAFTPGESIRVSVDMGGELRAIAGGERLAALDLTINAEGGLNRMIIAAPLDLPVGTELTVSADVPLSGDTVYTVVEGDVSVKDVDGVPYQVYDGFELEAPFVLDAGRRAMLMGRAQAMAFPPMGSAFPPGPYVGLRGNPGSSLEAELARVTVGDVVVFARSDGVNGPDENFVQMEFADPASAWGDSLYVCSASVGDGDGLFTVDLAATFAVFSAFNNCNGMAFDTGRVMGDPGYAPMYLNRGSIELSIVSDRLAITMLTSTLENNGSGFQIHVPQSGVFSGSLYLASAGDGAVDGDAKVWSVDTLEPFGALDRWMMDVPELDVGSVAFTTGTMGERMYAAIRATGELLAYRPDGTSNRMISGLDDPGAVVFFDDAIYLVERGSGQLLRLSHP